MSYQNFPVLPAHVPANRYRFEAAYLRKDLFGNLVLAVDDLEIKVPPTHATLGYQDVSKGGKVSQTLCVDITTEYAKAYGMV